MLMSDSINGGKSDVVVTMPFDVFCSDHVRSDYNQM